MIILATNKDYWKKRIDETAQRRFNLTYEAMQSETRKIYDRITHEIIKEVEDTYYKLLDEELSRTEIWTYKHYKDLLNSINMKMVKLGLKEIDILNYNLEEALREIYVETPLPQHTPIKPSFAVLDDVAVQQIIARSWSEKHFTSTEWDNKKELVRILKKGIEDCIVKGQSKDKLVKVVMEKMQVGFNRADMVVRTELMHTINEGQRQKYMDHGYDKGIILVAHDERLCEKCVKYSDNEKPRPLDEIVLPTHPRCRCTCIPVIE